MEITLTSKDWMLCAELGWITNGHAAYNVANLEVKWPSGYRNAAARQAIEALVMSERSEAVCDAWNAIMTQQNKPAIAGHLYSIDRILKGASKNESFVATPFRVQDATFGYRGQLFVASSGFTLIQERYIPTGLETLQGAYCAAEKPENGSMLLVEQAGETVALLMPFHSESASIETLESVARALRERKEAVAA